jgi:glucose/mannose transport system permease protein
VSDAGRLRGIDEDIWKAARVDGIPMWKTYILVIIPMMRRCSSPRW